MSEEEVPRPRREYTYNKYFQVRTSYPFLSVPDFLAFLGLAAVDKPKKPDASEYRLYPSSNRYEALQY